MKTKAVAPITITAPKLVFIYLDFYLIHLLKTLYTYIFWTIQEDENAFLLVRQQFDWWEDVENDITMNNTKALPGGTNIPATDTKSMATACTGPATAFKLVSIIASVIRG